MKKIILLSTIFLSLVLFTLPLKKVSATPQAQVWDLYHTLLEEVTMEAHIEMDFGDVLDDFTITIPNVNNHNVSLNSSVIVYDRNPSTHTDEIVLMNVSLANYVDVESGGSAVISMTGIEPLDDNHPLFIRVTVKQDFLYSNTPVDYVTNWRALEGFTYDYADRILVFYYEKHVLNGSWYFTSGTWVYFNNVIDDAPTTIPPDSAFVGWKTNTGVYYPFNGIIDTDWLITDGNGNTVLILYANYISTLPPQSVDEENPVNNTPAFIAEPMTLLDANNTTGYALLFGLLNIIIVMVFLLLKWPLFGAVISSLILMVAFMFMGALEGWIILLMFVIYMAVIVGSLRLGNDNGGGEV